MSFYSSPADESHQVLPDVRSLMASRTPCPVCGHPTGDCVGSTPPPVRIVASERARRKIDPGVLVHEDIYEQVYITERTKTKVLVAKAGSYIDTEKAIELGLIDK
jgi:hypothetical protein